MGSYGSVRGVLTSLSNIYDDEFFLKIINRWMPLNFLANKFHHGCLTGSKIHHCKYYGIERFQNTDIRKGTFSIPSRSKTLELLVQFVLNKDIRKIVGWD